MSVKKFHSLLPILGNKTIEKIEWLNYVRVKQAKLNYFNLNENFSIAKMPSDDRQYPI